MIFNSSPQYKYYAHIYSALWTTNEELIFLYFCIDLEKKRGEEGEEMMARAMLRVQHALSREEKLDKMILATPKKFTIWSRMRLQPRHMLARAIKVLDIFLFNYFIFYFHL